MSRKQLSLLINERAGFSSDMAVRISMATNTTAESWVNMQATYDLCQAKRRTKGVKVQKLAA